MKEFARQRTVDPAKDLPRPPKRINIGPSDSRSCRKAVAAKIVMPQSPQNKNLRKIPASLRASAAS